MRTVRVAVLDQVHSYVVLVDSIQDAVWLIGRLSLVFILRSRQDIQRVSDGGSHCTFEIAAQPWLSCERLNESLRALPRVVLTEISGTESSPSPCAAVG